jgi:F-box and leucine-rich repeat protein 2/20
VIGLGLRLSPLPLDQPSDDDETEHSCLTDVGLAHLARGCKGLEKLSLIWCSAISSAGLVSIAEHCKKLKSLDLQVIPGYLFCSFCCAVVDFFSSRET